MTYQWWIEIGLTPILQNILRVPENVSQPSTALQDHAQTLNPHVTRDRGWVPSMRLPSWRFLNITRDQWRTSQPPALFTFFARVGSSNWYVRTSNIEFISVHWFHIYLFSSHTRIRIWMSMNYYNPTFENVPECVWPSYENI